MEHSSAIRLPFLDQKNQPRLRDGDKEKPGFRYGWRLFAQVASSMGVDLSEEEIRRWRTTFGITRAIDDMVDEEGREDIRPALDSLLNGEAVGNISQGEALDFRASMANHSREEQQEFIREVERLAAFAKEKAQAASLRELIDLTKSEINWYASLFELKEGEKKDAENRRQFNEWLHACMTSGYMLDSLLDMEEDFQNGNIAVEPSLARKKALAVVTLKEVTRSLRKTPIRRLGSVAYIAYRYAHPPRIDS